MKPLALVAASLLALQGQTGIAQMTNVAPPLQLPEPPEPPRPSEAQVERFLASLPKEALSRPPKPDPETAKRLIAQHPGKAAQIAAILGAFEKCFEPAGAAAMARVNRMLARSPLLGAHKLERLTDFFAGGGWDRLAVIGERIEKSATPAAADLAERERLMAAYPLADFFSSLHIAAFHAAHQGAFAPTRKCEDERNAALAGAGVENPFKPSVGL